VCVSSDVQCLTMSQQGARDAGGEWELWPAEKHGPTGTAVGAERVILSRVTSRT